MIRDADELYFVFEFMHGNLYQWMRDAKDSGTERGDAIQQIRWFAYQIFQGLGYMHRHGFFHRDMKPGRHVLLCVCVCVRVGVCV